MALHDSSDYLLEVRLPRSFAPLVFWGVEEGTDIPGTKVGGHSQCCWPHTHSNVHESQEPMVIEGTVYAVCQDVQLRGVEEHLQ